MFSKTKVLLIVLIASVMPALGRSQAIPLFDQAPRQKSQPVDQMNGSPASATLQAPVPAASSTTVPSANQQVTVPAGTHVVMVLKSPLNSASGASGSAVYLETLYPVVQQNQVVIPVHTLVQGIVTANKRPGHFRRVSEFSFQFQTMIFPNNSVINIDGALQSIPGSGELRAKVNDGKLQPVDQTEAAIKPIITGAALGAVIGSAARLGVGKFVGAGLGAGAGLGVVLLGRGDEIRLNQGTNIEMVLRTAVQLSPEQAEFNAKYVPPTASR
jgi:hypothetical protein